MIRQLDPVVCARVRSALAIPGVASAIEEIVFNSVDAGASSIDVSFDLPAMKFSVCDNGRGMTADDLAVVGQRYHTSKIHQVEDLSSVTTYGFRGEALASLATMATVSITAQDASSDQSMEKVR